MAPTTDLRAGLCRATLALAALTPAALAVPDEVASTVADVTLYSQGAVVTRSVPLPAPGGSYVVTGLPAGIDPASVRVRCSGGEVVGVETRRHLREAATGERIETLRLAFRRADEAVEARRDEHDVARRVVTYYDRLLTQERAAFREDLATGTGDPERWRRGLDFFGARLTGARADERRAGWALEEAELALAAAAAELDGATSTGATPTWDVHVDVVGRAGLAALEVEYFVQDAGWTAAYDLRAAADLETVELVYRAEVWQRTGEDWPEVPILLSTARPELGTRGPDPETIWVGLWDPSEVVAASADSARAEYRLKALGYLADELHEDLDAGFAWAPTYAGAESEGLSVRFRLPRRETVASQEQPTTLLVGRHTLDVDVEHLAAPSVSERVWLRGRAANTSPWVMLPGEASAYVGADFVGRTRLGTVHAGADFDLPLGSDAGLALVRTKVEDLAEGPAFLRSKATETETWRIELTNYGALGANPDGSVDVIVQEVLPRSTDERLRVTLGDVTPALSKDERWTEDREEAGILTWVLRVPADGEAEVRWSREVAWPKDLEVVER